MSKVREELELINQSKRIAAHRIINSLDKIKCVLVVLIIICSMTGLAMLIGPAQGLNDDKKSANNTDVDHNRQTSRQMVAFDLPSISDIENNTNYTNPVVVNSIKELVARANHYLLLEPKSVTEKQRFPPSGDKHDFFSLAPFRWPDDTKPNRIPYIYRDGKINPEVFTIPDRANLAKMIEGVEILSTAYYVTDNILYASKATELLRVWFLNNNTRMNPSLQYAEVVTGKDNGTSSGIIAANNFPLILDSITIIQNSPAWTDEDQRGIEQWFDKYLNWLLNSDFGKKEGKRLNNHGTWYDVQASSIAIYLGENAITERILKNYLENRIDAKIKADGSQSFEIPRQTSLDYHIFNLQGLFYLAKIGESSGIDMWNYKTTRGAGLHKALDYLLPYAMEEETWPYKQIKPIKIDSLRILLCQAIAHYKENEQYLQDLRSLDQDGNSQIIMLLYGCLSELRK